MALDIGRFNQLKVVKSSDYGVYLDAMDGDQILLPNRDVPKGLEIGDCIDVFVYFDSDDRLIATTTTPKVQVGQCALLKVIDTNRVGAFLDWGLAKDLLVPFSEQQQRMQVGRAYVVYVFHDHLTDRIVASSKLRRHLDEQSPWLKPQQAVDLMVYDKTDLGYKAVIDNQYLGLIFNADAFRSLEIGERLPGFVKAIRPDGKIDLIISQHSAEGDNQLENQILRYLNRRGGKSQITDKSPPETIYREFKVSKKKYKNALGALYKKRQILITADTISLVD